MIKFSTISSFTNVQTFPNIKTHEPLADNTLVVPNHVAKVTALPTAATAQGKDLCVIMQNFSSYVGDKFFDPLNVEGAVIPKGENVLCIGLESINTRSLDIDSNHITGTFSSITSGTYLVAGTDGKFAISGTSAPSSHKMYFLVTDIISSLAKPLTESAGGVRVKIIIP